MVCAGITYDAGNDRINVEYDPADGTKGASFADPYNWLEDVYDTDVANEWGFVTKQGRQIRITKPFYITGANTYFEQKGTHLLMANEIDNVYNFVHGNAHYRCVNDGAAISTISGEGTTTTYRLFFFGADHYFKNCVITGMMSINVRRSVIDTVLLSGTTHGINIPDAGDTETVVRKLTIMHTYGDSGLSCRSNFQIAEDITLYNLPTPLGLYSSSGSLNFTRLRLINCGIPWVYLNTYGSIYTFLDSAVDISAINYPQGTTGDLTLQNLTTMKINIVNGDGGTAILYDKDGNVIDTEVLSGEWERITKWDERYMERVDSVTVVNEYTNYTPFRLVITKAGYQDLEIPNITVTPGEKTDVYGKLTPLNIIYKDRTLDVSIKDNIELDLVVEDKKELSLVVDIHSY